MYSRGEEMFRFETANFVIRAMCEPDFDLDLSWDDTDETAEKLASGEYTAFQTTVTVETKSIGGRPSLTLGSDSLGGSVYANPSEFFVEHVGLAAKSRADGRHYGAYFPDMVREAIAGARKRLSEFSGIKVRV